MLTCRFNKKISECNLFVHFLYSFYYYCLVSASIQYFEMSESKLIVSTSKPILDDGLNESSRKWRVCYFELPKNGSNGNYLQPEQIDPYLCTHIIIAFGSINNKNIVPRNISDLDFYKRVLRLKERNKSLKIMLSLAGGFPELVKSKSAVDIFAYNAREFLMQNNLDGLDLDWEFPAWPVRCSTSDEKQKFSYLVVQLWNSLKLSSHPPLLLSLAVAAPKWIISRSYEVDILAKNVDFINLMGYDYKIFWPYLPFTGHNAPLFKSSKEIGYLATLNIRWSANYWVTKGTPKEKLVIGIPTYGRTWKLLSFLWHDVGAPAVGQGIYDGTISYPKALAFLREGAQQKFDSEHRVPYSFMGRDWISYEDKVSIAEKVRWAKENDFAGVMTWNLNNDDYEGAMSGRKFDLHHVIKEILQ